MSDPDAPLIDSHAHLGDEAFDEDRDAALQRARDAGVEAVVVIGADSASSQRAIALAASVGDRPTDAAPALFATAGIAPHSVEDVGGDEMRAARRLLEEGPVVAVGEIGLEYHYDLPRPQQRTLFATQLAWARERELPVVVHSREAEDDMLAMLREHVAAGGVPGVLHCFTESAAMAERLVELGFYVSFSGIVTFPSAGDLREIATALPLDRVLVETDSPYLSPVPHRGERNEPARVAAVVDLLAELRSLPVAEVAGATADNARRLFGLPAA